MSRIFATLFFGYLLLSLAGCGTTMTKQEGNSFSDIAEHNYLQQDIGSDDWMQPLQQSSLKLLSQDIALDISDEEIETSEEIVKVEHVEPTKTVAKTEKVETTKPVEKVSTKRVEVKTKIRKKVETKKVAKAKPVKVIVKTRNLTKHVSRSKKNKKNGRYTNVWDRIEDGYQLAQHNSRVQHYIDYYTKHKSYFKRLSKNARPYLYFITEEIEKRGMPMELAFVPAVESAFKPNALSHKHAAGLWQFTPGTGKHFGLRQNTWYDARRDAVASTQAALEYLEYLHKFFDGDWLVALAAYNWGEGNVKRAIRKNKSKGLATDYWSLKLPKETRQYVPKLLAIAHVVAHRDRYGVAMKKIRNRPYLEQIQLTSNAQIDLVETAKLAGLSTNEFKRLNSGYRRGMTDPKKARHVVTLPIGKARGFKRKLAQIPLKAVLPVKVAMSQDDETKAVNLAGSKTHHRIRRGETLATVAKKYDMTIHKLRKLNKNINPRRLKIGQRIALIDKSSVETKATQTDDNKGKKIVHTVKPGDSLWGIAKNYKISIDKLTQWNSLSKAAKLKLGQQLTIWADG